MPCTHSNAKVVESAYEKDLSEVLYSAEVVAAAVARLGAAISAEYRGKDLIVVGILRGSFMFQADLVRHITVPHEVDFMMLGSYRGTRSTGNVQISLDMRIDPYNKHILIVEDLIDTGATLLWLQKHLKTKNALSVKLCTLLDKKTVHRKSDVHVDYVGIRLHEDKFIVGYGMDYNQHYRSLPCIGVLKPEVYQRQKGKAKGKADEEKSEEQSKDSKRRYSKRGSGRERAPLLWQVAVQHNSS